MPNVSLRADETVTHALDAHGDAIFRLALSYMKNFTDAEDILQDTLLKLLQTNPVFTSTEHEKAWLLRVAINLCKNRLRSVWFSRTAPLNEIPEYCKLEPDDLAVLDAVAALPVKYREVIHLFYQEGYSTFEISNLLGKNESTVRSLLHRARNLCKEKMLKEAYDCVE